MTLDEIEGGVEEKEPLTKDTNLIFYYEDNLSHQKVNSFERAQVRFCVPS